jgi:hypothetical protein
MDTSLDPLFHQFHLRKRLEQKKHLLHTRSCVTAVYVDIQRRRIDIQSSAMFIKSCCGRMKYPNGKEEHYCLIPFLLPRPAIDSQMDLPAHQPVLVASNAGFVFYTRPVTV